MLGANTTPAVQEERMTHDPEPKPEGEEPSEPTPAEEPATE